MRMTRTFQPVGQGAYFTERFVVDDDLKVNIVYDCGSDSLGYRDLEFVIHSSFSSNEEIDAVFISHFDNDHVNGLPILMKWCRVKKVILPVVSSRAEIAYWRFKSLAGVDKKNGYHLSVSNQLLDVDRERAKSIFEGFDVERPPEIVRVEESILGAPTGDSHENRYDFGVPDWAFVPYNFKRFDRESDFREIFKQAFGNLKITVGVNAFIANPSDVFKSMGENDSKALLKEINKVTRKKLETKDFRNRFGSINGNSMTLYSGELVEDGAYLLSAQCGCGGFRYRAGCLYTGDYEAKDATAYAELKNFYMRQHCWDGIGCVQLPHHGSKHNYNPGFDKDDRCYVASFGLGNRNHHPGKDVIVGLLKNKRKIVFSTEAHGFLCPCDICQLIV